MIINTLHYKIICTLNFLFHFLQLGVNISPQLSRSPDFVLHECGEKGPIWPVHISTRYLRVIGDICLFMISISVTISVLAFFPRNIAILKRGSVGYSVWWGIIECSVLLNIVVAMADIHSVVLLWKRPINNNFTCIVFGMVYILMANIGPSVFLATKVTFDIPNLYYNIGKVICCFKKKWARYFIQSLVLWNINITLQICCLHGIFIILAMLVDPLATLINLMVGIFSTAFFVHIFSSIHHYSCCRPKKVRLCECLATSCFILTLLFIILEATIITNSIHTTSRQENIVVIGKILAIPVIIGVIGYILKRACLKGVTTLHNASILNSKESTEEKNEQKPLLDYINI